MPKKNYKRIKSKYQPEWTLKFGLEVSTRDITTSEVTSAVCLFCRQFGREEDMERKRKLTTNAKYFQYPWRSDNINSHLKKQHPVKWEEYNSLSSEEKKNFFIKKESAEVVNMRSFVQPQASMKARIIAKQKCKFLIDEDIVETLICGLLFDDVGDDDEEANFDTARAKQSILRHFIRNEEDKVFEVEVKSILKLNLLNNFVSVGVSFRQASRLYQSVKEEMGMGVLGSISDTEVAHHCRIVCAINLQYLKEIFKEVWAFAIAIDAGNNAGTAYLDLRMRCFFKGGLQNLHIMAIPMRERHTGEYQYDLVVEVMDVLAPNWRHQLIGVSTDGASAMTGCVQGTTTRLSHECHSSIFRIWCGAHQLDLVVKKAFNELLDDKFLTMLTGVTGHLRRQQNLIQEMKSTCPTYVTTRWISMGKVLKWLKDNRIRLLQHFATKKPACTPSKEWWIVVEVVQSLVERIERTFLAMQGMKTLVCEQRQFLQKLEHDIKSRCNIKGPMTNEERDTFSNAIENDTSHGFLLQNYSVKKREMADSIDEVGGFAQMSMDKLRLSSNDEEKAAHDNIVSTVATFSLCIVIGISKVCAERDDRNSSADELPPVLPLDLCSVHSRDFMACLQQQRIRLKQKFSDEEVEQIDRQFRQLRLAFTEQRGFSDMLQNAQGGTTVQSFEQCWGPLGKDFEYLKWYCGGIASIMPGTSSVESDFSLINWTKDPSSQSLTDFSLEAILHCKQYRQLRDLFD